MASTTDFSNAYAPPPKEALRPAAPFSPLEAIVSVLRPIASLKLTVALLGMAIFLVFVGTLAQDEEEMWQVVHNYFRSPLTWVEFEVFFPKAWFPQLQGKIPGGIYFPGGMTVGFFMALNLAAAHAVRFKVQARGGQLLAGLLVILVGISVGSLVILGGHKSGGLQGVPVIGWDGVWYGLKGVLGLVWLASFAGAIVLFLQQGPKLASWLAAGFALFMTGLEVWLLYKGDAARMSDPSLRIVWQLAQGEMAGLILLAGCALAFRQRCGIVLLHAGVALIMFNELYVGLCSVEERMHIEEGQVVNFARDIRTTELAIVDPTDAESSQVVVIPQSRLRVGQKLRDERLPFDVEVVKYYRNADLRSLKADEQPLATAGEGTKLGVEELQTSSGADTDSKVDFAAAYVKLTDKNGGGNLGTYLLSQVMSEQEHAEIVKVGKKSYDLFLRFKRNYKPYTVRLLDVSKRDYVGTATPRDYSSEVRFDDPNHKFQRDIRIWMNNPLRYAGETFYQSGYNRGRNGVESTDLQVVTNTGWMIPYLGCMVVATGMLAQFSLTLLRFVAKLGSTPVKTPVNPTAKPAIAAGHRPARRQAPPQPLAPPQDDSTMRWISLGVTLVVVLGCAFYLGGKMRPPPLPADEFDIHAFGRLPLVYQGRVKPFDTLARNSLRIISDREDFKDEDKHTQPAVRWLLDLISGAKVTVKDPKTGEEIALPRAFTYKVFRIENDQVLDALGLERRPGSYRYSAFEMFPKMEEFEEQVKKTQELPPEEMSVYQKKLLELDRKFDTVMMIMAAFRTLDLPPIPTEEEFKKDPQGMADRAMQLRAMLQRIPEIDRMLATKQPPLAVPVPLKLRQTDGKAAPDESDKKWVPYAKAWHESYVKREILKQPINPAAEMMHNLLAAYAEGNAGAFNREVGQYQEWLDKELPKEREEVAKAYGATPENLQPQVDEPAYLNAFKLRFEAAFNNFSPFYYCSALYVVAFLLSGLGLLAIAVGAQRPFQQAAFWLIVLTLFVHTLALIARIYISGRPPVTSLYSSAIFIGWGVVIFAVLFEAIYRVGLGNIVAAVAGFLTLVLAHLLAWSGDTMVVLQAVLDTQFWLATHVTCVTLGYATTFLAGLLAVWYLRLGLFSPILGSEVSKISYRGVVMANVQSNPYMHEKLGRAFGWMIYGALCFAIFFSFVGTVFGGLWADDSWGRFWGWDPKENGALIIVLWNALVLHARWGGLVKDRGLAVLAVAGNIVVAWSWFGVNELGIGLHSYGFTEGVLPALSLYVAWQLIHIAGGLVPKGLWWSFAAANRDKLIEAGDAPVDAQVL